MVIVVRTLVFKLSAMKKSFHLLFVLLLPASMHAQTWNQDIAPIIYDHCGKCHHDGGIGPMSLVHYADAADEIDDMVDAILDDEMPPWPADHTYSSFIGENVLSEEEKEAIIDWMDAGTPEGTGTAPPVPTYNDGFVITDPDEIFSIPNYNVTLTGDEYRTFVVASTSDEDRNIGAVEFDPGNTEIVHHILAFYDPTDISQQYDDATPEPGYPSNGGSFPSDEAVLIGVWVPGMGPTIFPENLAIELPGGADIVFEVHYAPGSEGMTADVSMRLQYKDLPVIRPVWHDPLLYHAPPSLDVPLFIPANTVQEFHQESVTAPVNLSFISIFPHMHLLGKTYKVFGVTAEEDTIPFIHVDHYDFHWQFSYMFPTMKLLPQGSVLHGYASYDNTEGNPHNPNNPPADVGLGEGTTDEMMICFFMYTYYLPGDENISLVGVHDKAVDENESLLVWPNPADESIIMDIPNHLGLPEHIALYDGSGRQFKPEYSINNGTIRMTLASLPAGIYTVSIDEGMQHFTARFIRR
jgi:hypothetical protein